MLIRKCNKNNKQKIVILNFICSFDYLLKIYILKIIKQHLPETFKIFIIYVYLFFSVGSNIFIIF